jgi:sterol desaturase/sphingolipid hydroxylase (fatty acid hydroxylase superfamily)
LCWRAATVKRVVHDLWFDVTAFAIPLFTAALAVEYVVTRKKGRNVFRFSRYIANINVGIAERVCDTLITGLFFFVYDYLHRHFLIFDIRPSILLWITLLIATDFVWYWYHRLAHEINIFWATHIVHHQSEDFNYIVSARIPLFHTFSSSSTSRLQS